MWYGSINLLAAWVVRPIVLGSLEIIQADGAGIWLAGIFGGVILLLVGTPFLLSWGGRRSEQAYLAPLVLALTKTPQLEADVVGKIGGGQRLIPDGPAIVEGERYGRLIHIETIGRHSLTVLQAQAPSLYDGSERCL